MVFFPAILFIRGGTFLKETLSWKLPHSWSLAAPVSHTRWTVMGLLPHLSLFWKALGHFLERWEICMCEKK